MIAKSKLGRAALLSAGPVLISMSVLACGGYDPPTKDTPGAAGSSQQGGSDSGTAGTPAAGTGGSDTAGGTGGTGGGQGGSGGTGSFGELPCPEQVPTDTTCGGDIAGTWAATSCPLTVTGQVNMQGLGLGCQTGTITSGSLKITEGLTLGADGKFTDTTRLTGEQVLELPASCLTVSGATTTCDRVKDPFATTLGYKNVDCVDNEETGGCTCQAEIDQVGGLALVSLASPDKGSFKTEGGVLTLTNEGEDAEYNYCVADSTLAVTVKTVGKTGAVNGTIVLQKK